MPRAVAVAWATGSEKLTVIWLFARLPTTPAMVGFTVSLETVSVAVELVAPAEASMPETAQLNLAPLSVA